MNFFETYLHKEHTFWKYDLESINNHAQDAIDSIQNNKIDVLINLLQKHKAAITASIANIRDKVPNDGSPASNFTKQILLHLQDKIGDYKLYLNNLVNNLRYSPDNYYGIIKSMRIEMFGYIDRLLKLIEDMPIANVGTDRLKDYLITFKNSTKELQSQINLSI